MKHAAKPKPLTLFPRQSEWFFISYSLIIYTQDHCFDF